ncbi:MAG: hypothetical protein GY743_23255 [Planctomycetaceae bacterium]|nr:hypothetical protein [Planctomycetaceae bacterium]
MTREFHRLLQYIADLPPDRKTHINVDGKNGCHWEGTLQELKNILQDAVSFREIETALKEVHPIVAGETLPVSLPKWEYRWYLSDRGEHLAEIGQDGWEAILLDGKNILFKRPK